MQTDCRRIADALTVLVFGGLCLVVSALTLLPPVEQGRREARVAQTWIRVRQIQRDLPVDARIGPIPHEVDPWGNPFQAEQSGNGGLQVISPGPDGATPDNGLDEDDISSDMQESPSLPVSRRRNWQLVSVLVTTLGSWGLLSWLYLRKRRRVNEPDYIDSRER